MCLLIVPEIASFFIGKSYPYFYCYSHNSIFPYLRFSRDVNSGCLPPSLSYMQHIYTHKHIIWTPSKCLRRGLPGIRGPLSCKTWLILECWCFPWLKPINYICIYEFCFQVIQLKAFLKFLVFISDLIKYILFS